MGRYNTNALVVTGSSVGVRKSSPTVPLDISGSVFITGSLTVTDGIKIQGAGSDIIHPFLLMGA
jgi:hypothetical protein